MIDAKNFISISTYEFAKWNSDSEKKQDDGNIHKFVKNTNSFSVNVTQEISSKMEEKEKSKCLEFFVLVAHKLLDLGNFNLLFCLLGSLNSFEKLFPHLPPKIQEHLKEFSVLMSPQNNFKTYREKFKKLLNEGKSLIPVLRKNNFIFYFILFYFFVYFLFVVLFFILIFYIFNFLKILFNLFLKLAIHLKDVYYMFEHTDIKNGENFMIEIETLKTLSEFKCLMNTLQNRWKEQNMNVDPNLSNHVKNRFGFL